MELSELLLFKKEKNITFPFLPNCQNFLHVKSSQTRRLLFVFWLYFFASTENREHAHFTEAQNHQG